MKKRGFSITELLVAMGMMAFTLAAISSLFVFGLRSFQATTTDTNINQTNAQGMRRVTEALRSGMSLTISSSGRIITYSVPKMTATADAQTGEKELVIPVQADGAARTFTVTDAGTLVDSVGNRVLVRNIRLTDPDPGSSQFNQTYAPFSMTTVGSERAVTLNLITAENVFGRLRYTRLKTTVVLHNR
jgi:type II secretory pathway pseudopilin PulG